MKIANLKKLANSQPGIRHNIMRRLGQVVSTFILIALILFISAGSLDWLYAWLYMAVYLLVLLIGSLILPLELIAEQGSKKENVEKWDTVLSRLIILSSLGMFLVAGLDFRWRWSSKLATGLHLGSIFIFILGCALVFWAMSANRFFSTDVRFQFERGHIVCSSGPYKYVRHPGYLGMILYILVSPIFLGSLWAMIPALMIVSLFVTRTWLEDKTLLQKLPGYGQYAARIRYHLLPWLW
jgi:protein-S-isoprenylcysteine O-methyltransferase Ste14